MAAFVAAAPAIASFAVRAPLLGRNRALLGSTQALSLIPGTIGQYVRNAFLRHALAECAPSVVVEFGTMFSQAGARLEAGVYIGPMCHIGLVHIERDALIASAVHLPSGPDTHGTSDLTIPIRDQPGNPRVVRIGTGSWIGSGAIVMADVGAHSVVAAGAVVTRPLPSLVIAGGVPAIVLKQRA